MTTTNITANLLSSIARNVVEASAVAGSPETEVQVPAKPKRQRKPAAKKAVEPAPAPKAEEVIAAPEMAEGTRDYAAMRRFIKKYGRHEVELALRAAAREEGGRSVMSDDDVITIVAAENPHAKGTKNWKRFNKYRNGMTVAQAEKAGIERANIRYLKSLGHIEVRAAE